MLSYLKEGAIYASVSGSGGGANNSVCVGGGGGGGDTLEHRTFYSGSRRELSRVSRLTNHILVRKIYKNAMYKVQKYK